MAITTSTIPKKPGIVGGSMGTTSAPTTNGTGTINQVQTYNAAQLGDPTRWEVDDNQTVQGQIQGIIAKNSPLMQQAETRAKQQMNARGLLNSSLAITAGQSALYDAAMPIASQDAETYAKSASYNADTSNKFAVENFSAQNKALEFNATAGNRAAEVNATNETTRYGHDRQLEGTKYSSDRQLEGTRYNADRNLEGTRYDADRRLEGTRYSSDRQLEGTRYSADASASAQRYSADASASAQRYSADTRLAETRLSTDAQRDVANIQGRFNSQIQNSQTAASLYQTYISEISRIDQSELDPQSKANARYNLSQNLYSGMQTLEVTSGVQNLSFHSNPGAPPGTPAPAPAGNMQNSVTAPPVVNFFPGADR